MKKNSVIVLILFTLLSNTVLAQNYNRIISLSRSITQNIYLLGASNKLVGCTSYCDLAIQDNKEVIASATDVNIEKVILQNPDLVMATTITKPETIEKFKKLGIKVVVFGITKSYEDICENLLQIASYTGTEKLANSIIAKQKTRLDSIRKSIPKDKKLKMFFQIGANPIFTVIPNTFMNDFITYAGCENVASDLKRGTITYESVILRNPDVIIIVTMGILGEQEKARWTNNQKLSATKNRKIFIIDSDKACSPTPVTFIDVVEELSSLIYN